MKERDDEPEPEDEAAKPATAYRGNPEEVFTAMLNDVRVAYGEDLVALAEFEEISRAILLRA